MSSEVMWECLVKSCGSVRPPEAENRMLPSWKSRPTIPGSPVLRTIGEAVDVWVSPSSSAFKPDARIHNIIRTRQGPSETE